MLAEDRRRSEFSMARQSRFGYFEKVLASINKRHVLPPINGSTYHHSFLANGLRFFVFPKHRIDRSDVSKPGSSPESS